MGLLLFCFLRVAIGIVVNLIEKVFKYGEGDRIIHCEYIYIRLCVLIWTYSCSSLSIVVVL